MRIIAISVFHDHNTIQIQLNSLVKVENNHDQYNPLPLNSNLADKIKQDYRYTDLVALKAELILHVPERDKITAKENGNDVIFDRCSISYQLPVTPNYALHFLVVISDYFANNYGDTIVFLPHALNHQVVGGHDNRLSMTLEELCASKSSRESFTDNLINAILKTEDIPSYQPAKKTIVKLHEHAKKVKKKFADCADIETRLRLLSSGVIMSLVDPTVGMPDKLQILFDMARNMIKVNQRVELNYILATLNHLARKKLFEPCIGKEADDKGYYNWQYTEWELLRFAQFTLRPDGRLSIKNLKDNPKYQEFYASNCVNHAILDRELRHLGNIIGLEFVDNCNVHEEIIFTEDCTRKLQDKGLHFSGDYIKKLLLAKNHWITFNQGFKYNVDNLGNKSSFYHMPIEIIDLIRASLNLQEHVIVDKGEMAKVGFFGRRQVVQLTMTETEEVTLVSDVKQIKNNG